MCAPCTTAPLLIAQIDIWPILSHVLSICVFVFAVVFVARLLMEKRQPSNTFAWLLIIVLVPYVGVPLFLLIGGRKLKNLMARKTRVHHTALTAELSEIRPDMPGAAIMQTIRAAGGIPPVTGNKLRTLTTGEAAYDELAAQIKNARHTINISTFILGRDETGREIVQLLAERAQQGVKVRLLIDAVGSFFVRRSFVRPIFEAGGEVQYFMRVIALPFRGTTNLRNHRKIAVFDSRTALVGGHNIALEYMGAQPRKDRWRDFACVITGPATIALNEIFLADWSSASGQPLDQLLRSADLADARNTSNTASANGADPGLLQVVASGPDTKGDPLYEGILSAVQDARKSICIVTPYFIPDEVLWRSLIVKARAAVAVTLLVPEKSNHPITDFARRNYVRELHAAGARIMYYKKGMVHSKGVITDGRVALFGSANFDLRSLFVNFEVGVFVYSPEEVRAIQQWADALLAECVEVQAEPQPRFPHASAVIEDICRLIAPLL